MGTFVPYMIARQKARAYRQGKHKYSSLVDNLDKLRSHVATEADRWPIYARPVMFTDIDHDAQVEFAKAHQALNDASRIIPEIETIPEPELPAEFDIRSLFLLNRNLEAINLGNRLTGNVTSLENKVDNLESSVKIIRVDWYKVEKKRREVRQAVRDLKKRIVEMNNTLKSIDSWGSVAVNQVSWALTIADNCHLSAQEHVLKQSDDEQGYLEHAIADVFVEIGNFSLDCVSLFLDSQMESRRYDLDLFTDLFRTTTEYLRSILMIGDWNSWRKLQRAKIYIDKFPETKESAIESLNDFKHKRSILEGYIKQIYELKLSETIEITNDLEKECTYYWYSYEERKSDWVSILGKVPLPSVALNKVQSDLVTDIIPTTGIDIVIRQSNLPNLINKISKLLGEYKVAEISISRLRHELKRHKDAQKIVNAHLSQSGAAYLSIGKLIELLDDTSPEINESGSNWLNTYKNYADRANRVRGANFPDLQDKLDTLVKSVQDLIEQHTLQLAKLESAYEKLRHQIKSFVDEIDQYMHHVPSFDNQSLKAFGSLYNGGWGLLRNSVFRKYSWLTNETSNMQRWIQIADPYVVRAREKYQAFNTGCSQVEKQLKQTKDQIGTQRLLVERKWGWVRGDLLPVINQAEQNLNIEISEWKRLSERKWAELTIHQAIIKSENLIKFAEQLLNDLNIKIGSVLKKQNLLKAKVKDIKELSAKNTYKLSEEERIEIHSLLSLAERAENYEIANSLIDHANNLSIKRASRQERTIIKQIINSGGGTIIMGNLNTSGGDFVGRDVNSN